MQNEEDSIEDIEENDEEEVKDFETDFDADSGDDQRPSGAGHRNGETGARQRKREHLAAVDELVQR